MLDKRTRFVQRMQAGGFVLITGFSSPLAVAAAATAGGSARGEHEDIMETGWHAALGAGRDAARGSCFRSGAARTGSARERVILPDAVGDYRRYRAIF